MSLLLKLLINLLKKAKVIWVKLSCRKFFKVKVRCIPRISPTSSGDWSPWDWHNGNQSFFFFNSRQKVLVNVKDRADESCLWTDVAVLSYQKISFKVFAFSSAIYSWWYKLSQHQETRVSELARYWPTDENSHIECKGKTAVKFFFFIEV